MAHKLLQEEAEQERQIVLAGSNVFRDDKKLARQLQEEEERQRRRPSADNHDEEMARQIQRQEQEESEGRPHAAAESSMSDDLIRREMTDLSMHFDPAAHGGAPSEGLEEQERLSEQMQHSGGGASATGANGNASYFGLEEKLGSNEMIYHRRVLLYTNRRTFLLTKDICRL